MTLEETIIFCENRRTHRSIGAYITESLFERCFINKASSIKGKTSGWYYSHGDYDSDYIFLFKNEINDLDREIISMVTVPVWQICQYKGKITLIDLNSESERILTSDEFVAENDLKVLNKSNYNKGKLNREQSDRDTVRKYCNYLQKENLLSSVIERILVEDNFLNKYFHIVDLDCFIKNDMGVLLFEIKFKYPTKKGTYGINVKEAQIINYFNSKGINIFNVILENKSRLDVVDYISQGEDNYIWIYKRFKGIKGPVLSAPAETSYFNSNEIKYIEFDARKYIPFPYSNNVIDMTCPLCHSKMVLREGSYGQFLGCSQYWITQCKGKIRI